MKSCNLIGDHNGRRLSLRQTLASMVHARLQSVREFSAKAGDVVFCVNCPDTRKGSGNGYPVYTAQRAPPPCRDSRARAGKDPRFYLPQARRGITFRCVPCTTQPWRPMGLTLSHGNCADGCGLMGGHGGYGPALTPREPKNNVSMQPIQVVRGNHSQSDQIGNQSSYNMKCPGSEMQG